MRRFDLTFRALLIPLDFVALNAAALAAYSLRFSKTFTDLRPILQTVPVDQYISVVNLFAIGWLLIFAVAGLYNLRPRPLWTEAGRIVISATAGTLLVIATLFLRREVTTSRFLVLAVLPLSIGYVCVLRWLLRFIRYQLLQAHIGQQRIVIIGKTKTALELVQLYEQKPSLGYLPIKTWKTWNETARREIERLAKDQRIDGILLADPDLPKEESLDLIALAEERHLDFRYLADQFAASFAHVEMSTESGIPILEVKRTPLDGWGRVAKRLFDIAASSILIVLLSPIMILMAIAIKLDSEGTVFFSRLPNGEPLMRIGERGVPFHYLKFRSMLKDQDTRRYKDLAALNMREGPLIKIKDDPRITRVGHVIRRWSLDELSELFLVLLGRMSLVGPRPHLPEEVAKYERHHRRVLTIKPGITGMAQISGRSDLHFEDEVRLDTWYIEHWSLWLDLWILFKTPLAVIAHRESE